MPDDNAVHSAGNGSDGRRGRELDDLLAEYVERLNSGEILLQEEILAEHPDLGPEIVDELETFVEFGLQDDSSRSLGTLGDYTLRRQIGRGGMGVVYEAWQNSVDRQVALKVLPAGVAADTKSVTRFIREAKTAAQLKHPNVVAVHAMGVDENTPYYAMELVEGETLAQIMTRLKDAESETDTPFGRKDDVAYFGNLARAFADVADGLQHAHSKGVVHRDIKPSNLILDSEGTLRILDFGLARIEGQESITLSGDVMGTPLYMSPEQARRKRIEVDHRTDVYSLGATMYEAICGRPPFRGKDHADTLSQIVERDPVEPGKVNPRVPKDLETIVLKCLRKDQVDRYGTSEALEQDLRRFVRGDPIEARPQSGWQQLARRVVRLRKRFAVGGALVLLILTVAGWLIQDRERTREQIDRAEYPQRLLRAVLKMQRGAFALRPGGEQTSDLLVTFGKGLAAPVTREELRDFWGLARSASVDTAIEELEGIVRALPEEPDAHFHLARAYWLVECKDESRNEAIETLELDPDFIPARVLLWELTGAKEAAFDEMRAASASSEPWQKPWLDVYASLREKKWSEAVAAHDRLHEATRDGEPYIGFLIETSMSRGLALLEAGDPGAAREPLAVVLAHVPGFSEAALLRAKAYYAEGRRERAEEIFEDLYRNTQHEEKNEAALLIAAVYHALGARYRALGWIDRRLNEGPLRERLRSFFLFRLGRTADAIEAGRQAIKGNPRDPIAHVVLAQALLERLLSRDSPEERSELIQVAQRAVELDPKSLLAPYLWDAALTIDKQGDKRKHAMKTRALLVLTLALSGGARAQEGFFGEPERVSFSNGQDIVGSVTADHREFYFGRLGCYYDLFVAKRTDPDDEWGAPTPIDEINTCDLEGAPTISPDGLELYFVWRPSSLGRESSIHVATRGSRQEPWGTRTRLEIDSDVRDIPGCLSADGLTFYFSSDRGTDDFGVANKGGRDFFYATRPAVRDAEGRRVPFRDVTSLEELNSRWDEVWPTVSSDGLTIVWSDHFPPDFSVRPGARGLADVWMATRSSTEEPFSPREGVNLGAPVNTEIVEAGPQLSADFPASGSKLYFIRGTGEHDSWLWEVTWHADCNGNGVDDLDEITAGDADDLNANDIPDECDRDVPTVNFRRGDSNADGAVNIADGVATLGFLFVGDSTPPCLDAADTDDSGGLDVADSIATFNWLFADGAGPVDPGPERCGEDPTDDVLGCANPPDCQ